VLRDYATSTTFVRPSVCLAVTLVDCATNGRISAHDRIGPRSVSCLHAEADHLDRDPEVAEIAFGTRRVRVHTAKKVACCTISASIC